MEKTILFFVVLFLTSCVPSPEPEKAEGEWIRGTAQEKIDAVERHVGGFGTAMIEAGYRYQELYWAGKDENWEYADYQLSDLQEAIENGIERRPKRGQSAQHFLNVTIPDMEEAISSQDTATFFVEFERLRTGCNNCHLMEDVPFIQTEIPKERLSPIRFKK